MKTDLVPDDVWSRLDPSSARLDRRSRRLLFATVLIAVVVALATVLGMTSGLMTSQLTDQGGGGGAGANSHVVTSSEQLVNSGWFAEHIDAIEVTTPGFRLVHAKGVGRTIAPGQTSTVSVVVRVLDCSRITRTTGIPVRLRLRRFWGHTTLTISAFQTESLPWDACHRA